MTLPNTLNVPRLKLFMLFILAQYTGETEEVNTASNYEPFGQ